MSLTTTPANIYLPGAAVRLSFSFQNDLGNDSDPTAITLQHYRPDSNDILSVVYPGPIVRDSIGNYHFDYTLLERGVHEFFALGTGGTDSLQVPLNREIRIADSRFTP